jgi:hypothetical protein
VAFGIHLLGAADFHHLLGRHHHLLDRVGQALQLGLFHDLGGDFFLEPGIDMQYVPALGH